MKTMIAAAAAALACVAGSAAAQSPDFNATPNFGETRLYAGFTPDPYMVSLRAGGDQNARNYFSGCSGYITRQPDFRLYWNGNGSLPLVISAISNADTTLVINGPTGSWYCDDDSGEGSNPVVRLDAMAGRYEIWVGTYSSGSPAPAVLSISELHSF